ncbi:MAG: YpdA family putative bacillithiol disulfide reductase [Bacteroidetes bacterium]|nr:YpdA family putative bacillithiol disulfide reductase [Bacteroidota bacterium]
MSRYDVLIIGAGPIGLAAGIAAQKANLSYIIVEKGCLVNSLYNYPVNMTFFSTAERLEIGGVPFMSINPKPRRAEALEYYRRVAKDFNLNIKLFEKVENIQRSENDSFNTTTSKANYVSDFIIVATGFYDIPQLLHVPGEELPKVRHYYDDPHYYAFQKVMVVGASNSSVDAALETWRKGADVTMVVRKDTIGKNVKYWVRPDIENRIKEGSIKAYFNSNITAIHTHSVDIQTSDGKLSLDNDYVLALTGYQPDFKLLENLNITISADEKHIPVYNQDTMETNQEGIYLAGVVCGGFDTHKLFIENSREHAEKIINDIIIKKKV